MVQSRVHMEVGWRGVVPVIGVWAEDGLGWRQVVGADAPVGASRKVSPGAAWLRQSNESGGVRIALPQP